MRSGLCGGSDAGAAEGTLHGRKRGRAPVAAALFFGEFLLFRSNRIQYICKHGISTEKQPKTILYDQNDYPYFIAGTFVLLLVG